MFESVTVRKDERRDERAWYVGKTTIVDGPSIYTHHFYCLPSPVLVVTVRRSNKNKAQREAAEVIATGGGEKSETCCLGESET